MVIDFTSQRNPRRSSLLILSWKTEHHFIGYIMLSGYPATQPSGYPAIWQSGPPGHPASWSSGHPATQLPSQLDFPLKFPFFAAQF
jgi:hypothetical protein